MTKLKITCDRGHTEQIEINYNLGPYAQDFANLLAGRSLLYSKAPTLIGKCCHTEWTGEGHADTKMVCGLPIVVEVVK